MKLRPWLQGAGLWMIYLLVLIGIVLAPGQDNLYHQLHPTWSLSRGILLDFIIMTALLGLGFYWLQRMRDSLLRRLAWLVVLLIAALSTDRALGEYLQTFGIGIRSNPWTAHLPWILFGIAALLLLLAPCAYRRLIQALEVFLLSAGITTVFMVVPLLLRAGFRPQTPDRQFFKTPVAHPWQPGQTRVVWLLFDELSYNQVFDHPQPGLPLPAFDQLKRESVSFSQLQPIGDRTEHVIPSLLTGHSLTFVTSNWQGDLLWRSRKNERWQVFDPAATVFAKAQQDGWSTGIAGWYNPYCRLLANDLNRCYWTYLDFASGNRFHRLSTERSTLANAWNMLPFVTEAEDRLQGTNLSSEHARDFARLLPQSKALLLDDRIRFAFVHLPVPHPPGIYVDPLSGYPDYLGNLVLADRTLAQLRAAIAATSAAKDTILIVSSDHSWRVPSWRYVSFSWTPEEEKASDHGQFDPRPVLMIHFPGEDASTAVSIDHPASAMLVHKLLLDIFAGRVTGPADVERLAAGGMEPEPGDVGEKAGSKK